VVRPSWLLFMAIKIAGWKPAPQLSPLIPDERETGLSLFVFRLPSPLSRGWREAFSHFTFHISKSDADTGAGGICVHLCFSVSYFS